ncbi:transporter [Philodulcilactobacillus myokoensis]|uniref:Transporter n=2 Tax=Philodulcilactobacillus myokoensis TaxID=2929573 RepID=A0A9W6B0M8_9LACO|nr:transporter [Philodulcilactobacillus myokoensis]
MTAGSIFSRILGAIYIIPWRLMFGILLYYQANALYVQGYNVYSFFLIISIAGIPSAIAKQVAHYNALNEYNVGVTLYKKGMLLAAVTGIICALILYFGAPLLMLTNNNDANIIPVMHSLAWAVLIIPIMSVTRGYFQGYQDMAPSAISQFTEQLARVAYMLLMTYLIMRVFHGSWVSAVSQSTFAAFIGAVFGIAILGVYYFKRRDYYRELRENSNNDVHVNSSRLYREILQQAVPFIILGAGITIFQLIDQLTFFKLMDFFRGYSNFVLNELYTIFAGNANKLIMITISLSSALAVTVVPLLSEAHTHHDTNSVRKEITNGMLMFEFVMLPASLGMAAVAGPIYRVFYGNDNNAFSANILSFSSIIAISFGIFTVASAIMQGIGQNKRAVKYFIIGTIVKILTQAPLIYFFGTFGPLISSGLGFMVANYLIFRSLNHQYHLNLALAAKKTNRILLYSILTYLAALIMVWIENRLIGRFVNVYNSKISLIITIVAALVGGFVYIYCTLKTRLADQILGSKVAKLRTFLKIK